MAKAEIISSIANPLLKEVRRAIARGELTSGGYCAAEGFHLLDEALRGRCEIHAVLVSESEEPAVEARLRRIPGARLAVLSDRLLQSISGAETSQGVIALVRLPAWSLDEVLGSCSLVVVLDGVQDPGNAGAIVRAAEAFGATGVLFLKGSVSPYNAKALRASAGSLFRLPFVTGADPAEARAALERSRLDVYAAVPAGAEPALAPARADLTRPCAFLIGSEARGVSAPLRAAARDLSIPTAGVESLNAAMAAGILLYEARRQRSAHEPV